MSLPARRSPAIRHDIENSKRPAGDEEVSRTQSDTVPPTKTTFRFIMLLYRQMPPNIQLNGIQRFYKATKNTKFRDKTQDYKDASGSSSSNMSS